MVYTAPHTFDISAFDHPGGYAQFDGTYIRASDAHPSSWADFMMADLILDPTDTYTFELDFGTYSTGTGQHPEVEVYSQRLVGDPTDAWNSSNWEYLGNASYATPDGTAQTLTVTIGPGIEDWDAAMVLDPVETRFLFEIRPTMRVSAVRMTAGVSGEPPAPPGPGEWTIPVRLSRDPDEDDSDTYGLVEGQMCVLDSGIVVVMAMSSYSYAVHTWAIDISGSEPVVGPTTYFNCAYEGYDIPVDPRGMILGDLGPMTATGDYTFAGIIGESTSLDSSGSQGGSGDYGLVGCLFTVDPDTLEVTRDHVAIGRWDADDVPYANVSVSRWGDKAVLTSASSSITPKIWLLNPDGTHDTISVALSDLCAGVAVSGDSAFFFSPPGGLGTTYRLYEVALPGGALTDHGNVSAMDIELYTWFGAALPGGKVAYTSVTLASDDLNLLVFDPALNGPYQISADARNVGWTGGYYSNVVSMDNAPDDRLLMGWYDTAARWAVVEQDGTIVESGPVANFTASSTKWYSILKATPDGRMAAIFSGSGYGTFGTYLSYIVPDAPVATGVGVLETRRRFSP